MKTFVNKRFYFAVTLLCQLLVTSSFSQSEMSTTFIGDRFNVYNGQVNYKVWSIAEFLVGHPKEFKLTPSERSALRSAFESIFLKQYLFEEESYWCERTVRDISLVDTANSAVQKEVLSMLKFLSKNLSDSKLSLYKDHEFIELLFEDEVDSSKLLLCEKVVLRENWYYDKVNNELKNEIIGLGIRIKTETVWLYFPKLKSRYKYEFSKNKLAESLAKAKYSAENQIFIDEKNEVSDFKVLVIESMSRASSSLEGQYVFCGDSIIFQYKEGLLSGKYVWKYASGQIRQLGEFKEGIRQGAVKSYYENGIPKSIKNYSKGFMEGRQEEFNRKGELFQTYHFSHSMLNGPYYHVARKLKMSGQFVNGLCIGDWKYEMILPKLWNAILNRNTTYFDANYKFEKSWKSQLLLRDLFKFTAQYNYTRGDKCLNNKCLSIVIK